MKKRALIASAMLAGICLSIDPVMAEQSVPPFVLKPSEPSTVIENDYNDITVTANRHNENKRDSIADVVIINKKKIEQMQAKSIMDVIKQLPGVQISASGGLMQKQSLVVRGLSSKYTLVLLNGVRLNSAAAGEAMFSALPLSGVERIEFIRGPRSAVYGADALAGVINIITEIPEQDLQSDQKNGFIEGTTGSNNYHKGSLGVSLIANEIDLAQQVWGKVVLSSEETEGYNVWPKAGYVNPTDFDRDGGNNRQLVTNLGIQFNEHWQFKINGFYNQYYTEYDAGDPYFIADKTDGLYYDFSTVLAYDSKDYQSILTLSTGQDKQNSYYDEDYILYGNTTKRQSINWFNYYQLNETIKIGTGVDWSYDNVSDSIPTIIDNSVIPYAIDSNSNTGIYLLTHLDLSEKFRLEGNIRYDNNRNYGDYTTWQLGGAYRFVDTFRITASAGTAFISPTFNDLYGPYGGNPDLKAETSSNYEVALDGYNALLTWRIAAFYNRVDNKIASDSRYTLKNIDQVTNKGIELTSSFMTGPLQHALTLNYTDAIDDSTDLQLTRVAKESASWQVSYQWQDWTFDVNYIYQGKRYDNYFDPITYDASRVELAPYSLIDIATTYAVTSHFTIKGKITNLFDKKYETESGYLTPERGYYLTLNYKF